MPSARTCVSCRCFSSSQPPTNFCVTIAAPPTPRSQSKRERRQKTSSRWVGLRSSWQLQSAACLPFLRPARARARRQTSAPPSAVSISRKTETTAARAATPARVTARAMLEYVHAVEMACVPLVQPRFCTRKISLKMQRDGSTISKDPCFKVLYSRPSSERTSGLDRFR